MLLSSTDCQKTLRCTSEQHILGSFAGLWTVTIISLEKSIAFYKQM